MKNKFNEILGENLVYSPGKFHITVEGEKFPVNFSSAEKLAKAYDIKDKIDSAQTDLVNDHHNMIKIMKYVQDFVLVMIGDDASQKIFDTPQKKDDYDWHLAVFKEIFICMLNFRMEQFNKIITSPMIEQIKGKTDAIKKSSGTRFPKPFKNKRK